MFKYLLAIIAISLSASLSAGFAQAQSQGNQSRVSLEDWDVGAVKIISEPKPAVPTKGKPGDTKAIASKQKSVKGPKTEAVAAKSPEKTTGKQDAVAIVSASGNIIDLTSASSSASSVAQNQPVSGSTGRFDIDQIVNNASKQNGIDPNLVFSVMRQESGFHSGAVSPKGARGLMQLIPSTAARFGVKNIFDPKENIEGGTKYLRFLLDTFNGDVELALAGYNAGEGAVMRYGNRIPPYAETQNYVKSIVSKYGQKTLRPVDISASVRLITAPVIIAMSDKGILMLSNSY